MPEPLPAGEEFDFEHPQVIESLWETFYQRLKLSIRQRVRDIHRPVASESEVALSAFNSFLRRAQEGQFTELETQDQMWRLLKTIAIRKTNDLRKHLWAQKRGGLQTVFLQADQNNDGSAGPGGVDAFAGDAVCPSAELELAEMFNTLLDQLPDERHRDVVLLKLQGASVAMIAEHLGTTTRTVQRLLKGIESVWRTDLLEN